jgi:hypothetical protein
MEKCKKNKIKDQRKSKKLALSIKQLNGVIERVQKNNKYKKQQLIYNPTSRSWY